MLLVLSTAEVGRSYGVLGDRNRGVRLVDARFVSGIRFSILEVVVSMIIPRHFD